MMPKFADFPERSAIGLKTNGELVFQFHLIQGIAEYENAGKKWEMELNKIDELQKIFNESKSKGEPRINVNHWLPYQDRILSILEEIFVKK